MISKKMDKVSLSYIQMYSVHNIPVYEVGVGLVAWYNVHVYYNSKNQLKCLWLASYSLPTILAWHNYLCSLNMQL